MFGSCQVLYCLESLQWFRIMLEENMPSFSNVVEVKSDKTLNKCKNQEANVLELLLFSSYDITKRYENQRLL